MLADIRYWENDATNKRYAIAGNDSNL
ncbi:hypothetical protein, partial [Escherichia coli]